MIKGNNQNECEHDKGSNAMGYYSPTGNDWALTGGWLNKLCSSLQRPRPLVHLPASCWNLFLRLTETTDKGADEHGNERMNMWSSWSLYFCALLFYISQIILLSLNIVIILYFFAWRCNFGDKHLRQKTEMTWNCIFLHETLNTVVRWRRQSVDNGLFTPLTDVMLVTGNGCSDTAVTAKVGLFSLADRLTTANFQLNVCNLDISFDLCLRFVLYWILLFHQQGEIHILHKTWICNVGIRSACSRSFCFLFFKVKSHF